jgi:hypothetical protein
MQHYQRPNPHLAASHYCLTAFDCQQSDSFPHAIPAGRFDADLTAWLMANNRLIMAVVLAVLGLILVGQGWAAIAA